MTMNPLVLDLETEKEIKEVGGKRNLRLLGVSVVGAYAYGGDSFIAYEKHELSALEEAIGVASFLIGFNIKYFDLPVLAPHVTLDVKSLEVLDLMDDVERGLGFRVSLDNLCNATLGAKKSGHGLEAIWWWRQGLKDKVKEYCLQDVRLTRDLYDFGKKNGYVVADTKTEGRKQIRVGWSSMVEKVDNESKYVQRSLI
jgi:DEAD/DEAH box helicase domain-containing protein